MVILPMRNKKKYQTNFEKVVVLSLLPSHTIPVSKYFNGCCCSQWEKNILLVRMLMLGMHIRQLSRHNVAEYD